MDASSPHRKRVRHFNEPGHVHELTFSCYLRKPLLTRDGWRRMLSRSIDAAGQNHGFDLVAFVYMPEHVHLLICSRLPTALVEKYLFAVKKPFSFRVKQDLLATGDPLIHELTIAERPGKQTFRFWQEGPGYDRNVTCLEEVRVAADYFHNNPVKRGLCETPDRWKWSSWKHYHLPTEPPDPDLPMIHGFPEL
jgi:putative transposase